MAPDRTNGIRSRAVETHAADDVHVRYRFTDPLDEATVRAAMSLLSDEERTRHDRFRARRDRDEYAVAHALLRTTLSMVGDRPPAAWRFTAGPQGKPAIASAVANEGLAFNLSHTRGLVACAVSRGIDVGIDVEAVTRAIDWRPIAARYFSPEEVAEIDRVDPPAQAIRFFEIWTLKEAFIKAVGTGLSQPLKAMTFSLEPREPVGFVPPAGVSASLWHFGLYAPAASHRLAVAVSDGTPRVRRIHVQDDLHSTG
jgi:phosphopantetheinyl transferase